MGVFAAYVALDLARRVHGAERQLARKWMLGGAVAMGTGVWSMHFIGMASLRIPLVIGHDPWITLASWLVAVATSAYALTLVRAKEMPRPRWILGSVLMGAGICAMHYLGMASMEMAPGIVWDWGWVAISMAVAVVAAAAALLMVFEMRGKFEGPHGHKWQMAAAVVVGLGIAAVHYTGMAAANFPNSSVSRAWDKLSGNDIWWLVTAAIAVLVTVTLMSSLLDARQGRTSSKGSAFDGAHGETSQSLARDPLTQLSNRLVFEDRLDSAVSRCQQENGRVAVLFIDLDGFKPVNASYGHATGDAVLREISERIKRVARSSDAVARIGADEFLLMLDGQPDRASAAQVAQRLRDAIREPIKVGAHDLALSCSIGIVLYPEHGPRGKLIANADAAMNAAKRAGGSVHCFYEAYMDASSPEQIDLQRDLRVAIVRNELELYYQPKIDSLSGQVTGVEALLRWHHPTRGMVSPGVFIPVAERFGIIGALGNWVIEESCRQIRIWMDKGLKLRVAINLSVHQLRQDDLERRIREALARSRVDPHLVTFEITESVAMEDSESSMRAFERLSKIGVQLSIDDFGTGYSSLSYLRRLPATQLKIDRSFIQDLGQSDDARAIVEAVVHLAHALDLSVVAEGVETTVQEKILKELGCDELQGFLFAKPMPAKHIMLWATGDAPTAIAFRDSLFDTQGFEPTQPQGA